MLPLTSYGSEVRHLREGPGDRAQRQPLGRSTKRRWLPNLHSMKINLNGSVRRAKVCSSCLSANKVTKVV